METTDDTEDSQIPSGPAQSVPKVLVAEDEEFNLIFFKHVLSKLNLEVVYVDDGLKALEYCKNNQVDLILMDIRMPVMDGILATKKIREFLPDIPVIALTAYGQTGDETKILDSGVTGILLKPVPRDQLLKIVTKYINR